MAASELSSATDRSRSPAAVMLAHGGCHAPDLSRTPAAGMLVHGECHAKHVFHVNDEPRPFQLEGRSRPHLASPVFRSGMRRWQNGSHLCQLAALVLLSCSLSAAALPAVEVFALANFKVAMGSNNSVFETWVGTDPCGSRWYGVQCSIPFPNRTIESVIGLSLPGAGLSGPLPPSLGSLRQLSWLILSNNDINSVIPEEFSQLSFLRRLHLSNNSLTGSIPNCKNFSLLVSLQLAGNRLTGTLTDKSLESLSFLTDLDLSGNNIEGSLPVRIGDLQSLQSLYLKGNKISGPLPARLGDLKSLAALVLSDNWLTGEIPTQLGGCESLIVLDLSRNRLSGRIPWQLGQLKKLVFMSLASNSLFFDIPYSFPQLLSLQHLYLFDNALNGKVPDAVVQQVPDLILDLNDQLCGGSVCYSGGVNRTQFSLLDGADKAQPTYLCRTNSTISCPCPDGLGSQTCPSSGANIGTCQCGYAWCEDCAGARQTVRSSEAGGRCKCVSPAIMTLRLFDVELASFGPSLQRTFVATLAQKTNLLPWQIEILRLAPGSVITTFGLLPSNPDASQFDPEMAASIQQSLGSGRIKFQEPFTTYALESVTLPTILAVPPSGAASPLPLVLDPVLGPSAPVVIVNTNTTNNIDSNANSSRLVLWVLVSVLVAMTLVVATLAVAILCVAARKGQTRNFFSGSSRYFSGRQPANPLTRKRFGRGAIWGSSPHGGQSGGSRDQNNNNNHSNLHKGYPRAPAPAGPGAGGPFQPSWAPPEGPRVAPMDDDDIPEMKSGQSTPGKEADVEVAAGALNVKRGIRKGGGRGRAGESTPNPPPVVSASKSKRRTGQVTGSKLEAHSSWENVAAFYGRRKKRSNKPPSEELFEVGDAAVGEKLPPYSKGTVAVTSSSEQTTPSMDYKLGLRTWQASGLVAKPTFFMGPVWLGEIPMHALQAATLNFDERNVVGKGSLGKVYRGVLQLPKEIAQGVDADGLGLPDAIEVGVKVVAQGLEAELEFQAIMELMGMLSHPNMADLVGFCTKSSIRVLVFRYAANGSLSDHLHGPRVDRPAPVFPIVTLTWRMRVRVAMGLARALEYLHFEDDRPPEYDGQIRKPCVYHGDVSSSNVLLDEVFGCRLSNFGQARVIDSLSPQASKETGGNMSPSASDSRHSGLTVTEGTGYFTTEGAVEDADPLKRDVYMFGVVLLELISGRRANSINKTLDEQNVVAWATPYLAYRAYLKSILDPALADKVPIEELHKSAQVAAMCVQSSEAARPTISAVVELLSALPQDLQSGDPVTAQVSVAPSRTLPEIGQPSSAQGGGPSTPQEPTSPSPTETQHISWGDDEWTNTIQPT